MRDKAIFGVSVRLAVFSAAAIILGGDIARQVFVALVASPTPAGSVHQQAAISPAADATAFRGDETSKYVATILARPLFAPSRRPGATGAVGAVAGLGRLSGVMVGPGGRHAIFVMAGGSKPIVVGEGAHIAGYVVQSIDDGAVTILGPDGHRTLRPTFDPGTPAKPAAPAPRPGAPSPR